MNSDFFDAVDTRRSVRNFSPGEVPQEVLERCFDAALKAPSSSNLQPWEFVIVRNPVVRDAANRVCLEQQAAVTAPLLVAVVAHRDTWQRNSCEILRVFGDRGALRDSQRHYWGRKIPILYRTGPFGLFGWMKHIAARMLSVFRPTVNLLARSDLRVLVHKSTALAAATFMLALRAEGFDSCPMEGFDPWRARKLLKLGSTSEVCMFIAVGKRAEGSVGWDRVLMPRAWMVREL
jgi:nitroreductase